MDVVVLVKGASSGGSLADVSVEFTLGDLVLTATTDGNGFAVFTLR